MSNQDNQSNKEQCNNQEKYNPQNEQGKEEGRGVNSEPEKCHYKKSLKQSTKRVLKQAAIVLICTGIVSIAFAAGFIFLLQHFARTPAQKSVTTLSAIKLKETDRAPQTTEAIHRSQTPLKPLVDETLITIRPGQSLSNIARTLETSAIIKNQYLFMMFAKYKGYNKKIQAGEYAFSGQYTPETILDMLIKGKVKLHRFTIPEGFNIGEIAAVVEKAGFGSAYNFIKLTEERSFIEALGIHFFSPYVEVSSLEGYLFPETYFFPAGTDQKKIITSMVAKFKRVFLPEWRELCKHSGFTVHDMVTLASIIEKETANSSERAIISSVFHNRLKLGMRLESDPTVIYGIHDFNGNITKRDLLTVTPYNTYAIYGLPEGPIANPGRLSLQAALFPMKSDFLFFVSRKDTTHHFSKTFEEHNQAVRKYQLNR